MSFSEKSAWAVIGALALAYGGYLVAVAGRIRDSGVDGAAYADAAVGAAVATVALLAAAHAVIAATGRAATACRATGAPVAAAATASVGRSPSMTILAAGAVVAIALIVTGAQTFWTANVLIAALVAGEIAAAAARITQTRAAARRA
ncbi:hypothetical protein [Demequina mangrovi]|uniref:Uncharacterized protein n=1 Tax=Demequina mangrovi TaxID=1043493 RepID=A0A1H6UTY0_9MICO|nr:hypothetical protein [Demequina mangrovi]SEI95873.1 hypothetical protein SAMN05421637_0547 [Demequina mangrovi]